MNMHPDIKALISAATAGDFARVRSLVANGADINGCDNYGDTVLTAAIGDPDDDDTSLRLAIARELISLGADPRRTNEDGRGPLGAAAIRMDTEVLRLLMDSGADPNKEINRDDGLTVYDEAIDDYHVRVWLMEPKIPGLPEEPDEEALATQDTWLIFLDRLAVKYGKRRPDHLSLLRERGARTRGELREQSAM